MCLDPANKAKLLERFTLTSPGQIPHFCETQKMPGNMLTPFTLQIAYLLLQLFCRNLQVI